MARQVQHVDLVTCMRSTLTYNWPAVMLRGVVAILFGLMTFFWPGITLTALALAFGVYAFLDGVFKLTSAIRGRGPDRWWALVIGGIAGIVAGAIAVLWPAITVLALVLVVGAWAFATGVLEIVAAFKLREVIEGEWLLGLGGVASIIFGFLVARAPAAGALALAWWIGGYALIFGAIQVALGFRLRKWERSYPPDQLERAA
jgi:uncharacterized membrane protein HdeD (DUF308 family)